MGEDELKSNSHSVRDSTERQLKTQNRHVEPVVYGTTKTKKRSDIHRFTDLFIAEDITNVGSYIIVDVLIPACKKAITDIITNGINMLMYGDTGGKRGSQSRESYSSFYYKRDSTPTRVTRASISTNFDEVIYEDRGDAEFVLKSMQDTITAYGFVKVGDYYDFSKITTYNFTVNDYGWYNLDGARVVGIRDGYVIRPLPKPVPID